MCKINIYEAKTQLSKYISLLETGQEDEVIIMKNGKPVAKLTKDKSNGARLGAGLLYTESKPFKLKNEEDDYGGLFGY